MCCQEMTISFSNIQMSFKFSAVGEEKFCSTLQGSSSWSKNRIGMRKTNRRRAKVECPAMETHRHEVQRQSGTTRYVCRPNPRTRRRGLRPQRKWEAAQGNIFGKQAFAGPHRIRGTQGELEQTAHLHLPARHPRLLPCSGPCAQGSPAQQVPHLVSLYAVRGQVEVPS